MDERRERAWRAMELGPTWRARAARRNAPATAETLAVAADEAESATMVGEVASVASQGVARVPASGASGMDWSALRDAVAGCTLCALSGTRTRTVFGVGPQPAEWMLVGEAPGAEEDARGEPFVGQAGRLLDRMLAAIGLSRESDVFIANVLKCRPPRNRDPRPEEVAACEPYLMRQIALVAPRVIVVLGRFAAQSLLGTEASIGALRGRVHERDCGADRVPVVVTYHPAYLLRSPADKAKAWSDLCLARRVHRQRAPA